ncbi:MAG: CZB domain-containing protein [Austwickia sp.]|nr:CZB domain-containing protein [Austwickia sp.]MBK8437250.1 CZB domain-containing protein [Austwickia sp.]MBK9102482.1 CZB domain-containing protein [Austwickia sp.]
MLTPRRASAAPHAAATAAVDGVSVPARAILGLLTQGDDLYVGVQELSDVLSGLDVSTRETLSATTSIEATTSRLADEASTVASAAGQMSAAMAEVAGSAAQASTAVLEAGEAARAVRGAATELAESAGKIDEVVRTVSRISDQTRLLALNATIEAARAGAAGKGFAVVAEEVKTLADETTIATSDIAEKLSLLAAKSDEVRDAIMRIDDMLARVEQLEQSIAAAVEEQSAAIAEITRSATTVSDAADGLRTDVTVCTTASRRAQDASERSHRGIAEMTKGTQKQRDSIVVLAPDLQIHPLRAAIYAHAQWKQRLHRAVTDQRLPEGVDIAKAGRRDACPFGAWLASGAAAELDATRAAKISELHARFHTAAAAILTAATTGQVEKAQELLSDPQGYAGIAPTMTAELSGWAQEVERTGAGG